MRPHARRVRFDGRYLGLAAMVFSAGVTTVIVWFLLVLLMAMA